MKIRHLLFIFFLPVAAAAQPFEPPLSSRTASYDINVELHPKTKTLTADEVIYWTNPGRDSVGELRLHVYLNAFKNNQSTFLRGGGSFGGIDESYDTECLWGYTDILKITDAKGRDLTARSQYIQPDDDNKHDRTVLQVLLHQAVAPGETVEVTLDWAAKIPYTISRTGYAKDFHFLVQWFPKIGVYEPAGMRYSERGGWNCHQYHAATEYYSDFGVYKVNITVPSDYIVGASGVLTRKEEDGDVITYSYRAEDVIDFAWTASPRFVEYNEEWRDVNLRLLTYADRAKFAPRIFSAAKNSLEYLDEFVGTYPYRTLTVVAPPFFGLKSGAMEYPTLVTTFAMNGLPAGMYSTETLTIHETVHQYFMQMIANNEQEEAWLDEGFTSYFEAKIMDKYYGGFLRNDYFDITIGSQELRRGRFFGANNIKLAPLSAPTYQIKGGSHREISYGKTAVVLWTLEGLVGEEIMRKIMQTYFTRWKFKHPCGEDFLQVVDDVVRRHYGDTFADEIELFMQQAVYGTEVCDYAVAGVGYRMPGRKRGVFAIEAGCIEPTARQEKPYHNIVTIYRQGEMQVPVEILMTYEDDTKILEKWDGKDRVKVFEYHDDKRIVRAEIDPLRKIYIDKDFINNSRTHQPQGQGIAKTTRTFFVWLQQILSTAAMLV